jgi:hypothetical protein
MTTTIPYEGSPVAIAAAEQIRWRETPESSNVAAIGWDGEERMYVRFHHGGVYLYDGVARQRAVACWRAPSVGVYFNKHIKPNYHCVKVT